jgi:2-dehydro-3-deoxygalactonokinase
MSRVNEYNLVIDGGTTNTRFVLMDHKNEKIVNRIERKVGASNATSASENEELKTTVKDVICELQKQNDCIIKNVYASGMITSNAGLYELAHIEAPATVEKIQSGIHTVSMPEISQNALFHFIPGIKFQNQRTIGMDMMRGEEVEIFGALEPEDYQKSIMFVHFGSHNKLIFVKNGVISNAITTIGGELLWAIANETILKSSIGNFEETFEIDNDYVELGYHEAKENNISRALFLARIYQVINQATEEQVKSFLYGALMFVDLQAFSKLLGNKADKIVLYGRDNFVKTFKTCIRLFAGKEITSAEIKEIDFEESEKLSIQGVKMILSNCLLKSE